MNLIGLAVDGCGCVNREERKRGEEERGEERRGEEEKRLIEKYQDVRIYCRCPM